MKKLLIVLGLVLVTGCSTTKLELRIHQLEQKQAKQAEVIGQWGETVEARFNTLRQWNINQEKVFELIGANDLRTQ